MATSLNNNSGFHESATDACPLCGSTATSMIAGPGNNFYHCLNCDLISTPPSSRLEANAARVRYLQHDNSLDNAGYVAMFDRPIELLQRCASGAKRVLDYGSGPVPVFVGLLQRAGYEATGYDLFFASETDLSSPFDAVTCIETAEHFVDPAVEFERIGQLLRPGGCLILMTQFHQGAEKFADWWYARDKTHVSFYSSKTLAWLCERLNWELIETAAGGLSALRRS